MIKLLRCDPDQNMYRFYALQLGQTLLGEWVLIAEWGSIGSPGTVQYTVFPSAELAEAALAKRQSVKVRRGYRTCAPNPEAATPR